MSTDVETCSVDDLRNIGPWSPDALRRLCLGVAVDAVPHLMLIPRHGMTALDLLQLTTHGSDLSVIVR